MKKNTNEPLQNQDSHATPLRDAKASALAGLCLLPLFLFTLEKVCHWYQARSGGIRHRDISSTPDPCTSEFPLSVNRIKFDIEVRPSTIIPETPHHGMISNSLAGR